MCSARAQPHIMRACSLRGCSYTLNILRDGGFSLDFVAFPARAEDKLETTEAASSSAAMKVPFAPPALHAPLLAAPLLGFDAPPLDLAAGSDLASASSLLLADDAVAGFDPVGAWTAFQDSHAVLLSFIAFIIYRAVIQEARMRIEKPIMDEAGRRVAENLTPDTKKLDGEAYAKLAGCILLDLAGDASELVPFLGEFTDIGFAPIEAFALKQLFKSNLIAGFGFVEEILPFTDVIPTFTLSWCLTYLWSTTPLAQKLLPKG